ncbi:hypothetical protein Pelo_6619 [Pelomyxa schiedti]|nr:hypothetical protein Pelo_6619 [Pelomyxa schiedti]
MAPGRTHDQVTAVVNQQYRRLVRLLHPDQQRRGGCGCPTIAASDPPPSGSSAFPLDPSAATAASRTTVASSMATEPGPANKHDEDGEEGEGEGGMMTTRGGCDGGTCEVCVCNRLRVAQCVDAAREARDTLLADGVVQSCLNFVSEYGASNPSKRTSEDLLERLDSFFQHFTPQHTKIQPHHKTSLNDGVLATEYSSQTATFTTEDALPGTEEYSEPKATMTANPLSNSTVQNHDEEEAEGTLCQSLMVLSSQTSVVAVPEHMPLGETVYTSVVTNAEGEQVTVFNKVAARGSEHTKNKMPHKKDRHEKGISQRQMIRKKAAERYVMKGVSFSGKVHSLPDNAT